MILGIATVVVLVLLAIALLPSKKRDKDASQASGVGQSISVAPRDRSIFANSNFKEEAEAIASEYQRRADEAWLEELSAEGIDVAEVANQDDNPQVMTDMLQHGPVMAGRETQERMPRDWWSTSETTVEAELPATIGRSTYEQDDGEGVITRSQVRDFLIDTTDLLLSRDWITAASWRSDLGDRWRHDVRL